MKREPGIWCPECKTRPHPQDRRACTPSCGKFSPHEAWYHDPEPAEEALGDGRRA